MTNILRSIAAGFAVAAAGLLAGSLSAEEPKSEAKTPKKTAKAASKLPSKISPEREAAVLSFVKTNHPELTPLITGLKESAPVEYTAALADLDKTVERLDRIKAKTPPRYEAQLADWKLTSRIRLLAARLAVSQNSTEAEAELRAAVVERFETRLANQRAESAQLQKRLEKLNAAIAESSSKKDELIEREIKQLKESRPPSKGKKANRPAAAQADEQADKAGDQK